MPPLFIGRPELVDRGNACEISTLAVTSITEAAKNRFGSR
jgi:hypothetical protein